MQNFDQPHDNINNLDTVFPGPLGDLLPDYESIPNQFKNPNATGWQFKLQREWFYCGLNKSEVPEPKPGIDKDKAIRHMACIQSSFEPKHEHKEAAVAYLFDLWFQPPKKSWKLWGRS